MKRVTLSICILLMAMIAYAQDINISGVVTSSDDGEPLIGASIQVKGKASVGTATDFDGNYNLTVPAGSVLQFSYVDWSAARDICGRT